MNGDIKISVDPAVAAFGLAGEVRRGRREFVKGLAAVAGATGLFGYDVRLAFAEPPPETTRIRIVLDPTPCMAPQFLAEELLRLEGFSQIEYVKGAADASTLLAEGKADFATDAAPTLIPALDKGESVVVLAGIHGGCYELFGNERVRSFRDL